LLSVAVHPADIQDRDGAAFVLNASTRALFPFIERIFADGGCTDGQLDNRDRQAHRAAQIRCASQAMDCRENSGMDQSQPPPHA